MTLSFPPDVFSRIEPEIYLQRHLAKGLRPVPGLRKFDEFRPVKVQLGPLNDTDTVGSALTKVGGTTVICGISLSTSENGPGGVYPNVEIVRGGGSRNAPPTQEEMLLSQQSFNALQNQLDPSLFQREELEDLHIVLNASVQVLSRTGPCFDAVYNTIVAALKDTKLPALYIDPDTKKVLIDDNKEATQFFNEEFALSSTFGIAEIGGDSDTNNVAVVADPEGDTEEACITSRIQVTSHPDGTLTSASIRIVDSTAKNGREGIRLTKAHVQNALELAARNSAAQ